MTTSEAVAEAPAQTLETALAVSQQTSLTIEEAVRDILKAGGTTRSGTSSGAKVSVQEVRLFSTHAEVEIKGIRKAISLLDFKQMIDSQLQVETKMEMMALPEGCYIISKSLTEMHIGCYYPERRLDLKHNTQVYKNCAMPNIIISHKLKNDNGHWLVVDSRYFATEKSVVQLPENRLIMEVDNHERIWLMPFPNFYNEGRMCYGGNTMPVKYNSNLKGLKYYYDVLAASPFNNDLGIHVNSWDRYDIAGWFKKLTEMEKFDYSYMRR